MTLAQRSVPMTVDHTVNYRYKPNVTSTVAKMIVIGGNQYGLLAYPVVMRYAPQPTPMVARFRTLADRWQAETLDMSSVEDMVLHPAYQEIIGMGPAVIPLLLDELELAPNHWFAALYAVSGGQNPVADHDAGDLDKMVEAWINWAEAHGYR